MHPRRRSRSRRCRPCKRRPLRREGGARHTRGSAQPPLLWRYWLLTAPCRPAGEFDHVNFTQLYRVTSLEPGMPLHASGHTNRYRLDLCSPISLSFCHFLSLSLSFSLCLSLSLSRALSLPLRPSSWHAPDHSLRLCSWSRARTRGDGVGPVSAGRAGGGPCGERAERGHARGSAQPPLLWRYWLPAAPCRPAGESDHAYHTQL